MCEGVTTPDTPADVSTVQGGQRGLRLGAGVPAMTGFDASKKGASYTITGSNSVMCPTEAAQKLKNEEL